MDSVKRFSFPSSAQTRRHIVEKNEPNSSLEMTESSFLFPLSARRRIVEENESNSSVEMNPIDPSIRDSQQQNNISDTPQLSQRPYNQSNTQGNKSQLFEQLGIQSSTSRLFDPLDIQSNTPQLFQQADAQCLDTDDVSSVSLVDSQSEEIDLIHESEDGWGIISDEGKELSFDSVSRLGNSTLDIQFEDVKIKECDDQEFELVEVSSESEVGYLLPEELPDLDPVGSESEVSRLSSFDDLSSVNRIGHETNPSESVNIAYPLDYIKRRLSKETLYFFRNLIDIQVQNDGIHQKPTICVGDIDGSPGRMILAAIKAEKMILGSKGLDALVRILNKEQTAIAIGEVIKFQENRQNKEDVDLIYKDARFENSEIDLIYLGDCAHDRFNCNKDIEMDIRERLHEHGVIFIRGNHDEQSFFNSNKDLWDQRQSFGLWDRRYVFCHEHKVQASVEAYNTRSDDQWQQHLDRCFVKAYLKDDVLYIHNGIKSLGPNKYETACGTFIAQNVQDLVNQINNSSRPIETGFRPSDEEIQNAATPPNLIKIRHGHNGFHNSLQRSVSNLNSRSDSDDSIVNAGIEPFAKLYTQML